MEPILLIHGGVCSRLPEAGRQVEVAAVMQTALAAGMVVLRGDGSALDAVQAAVAALEASGVLNAGRGAVRDADGQVLLDAMLMEGHTARVGAVAGVQRVASPVALARAVMERTGHVLLIGAGAERLADEHGLLRVGDDWFGAPPPDQPVAHGTVGAVARDVRGRLAAATSTGGTTAKLPGRVGDSPLAGAGTWADDACAVSATGVGEYFIRSGFAHRVAWDVGAGRAVSRATQEGLARVATLGGWGGCIALAADGEAAMPFIGAGMWRGYQRGAAGPVVAVGVDA